MRRRAGTGRPFMCASCDIAIRGRPMFDAGSSYCCAGCVAGGPCTCSYDAPPHEPRVRECLDVVGTDRDEPFARVLGRAA